MSSELVAPSVFPHLIVSLLCRQSVSQKISSQKEPETLGRLGRMRGAWHEEWNPQPPRELSSVCWETLTGAKRSDGGSTWNCWTQAQQYLFPDASLESISLLGTFFLCFQPGWKNCWCHHCATALIVLMWSWNCPQTADQHKTQTLFSTNILMPIFLECFSPAPTCDRSNANTCSSFSGSPFTLLTSSFHCFVTETDLTFGKKNQKKMFLIWADRTLLLY